MIFRRFEIRVYDSRGTLTHFKRIRVWFWDRWRK